MTKLAKIMLLALVLTGGAMLFAASPVKAGFGTDDDTSLPQPTCYPQPGIAC